MWAVCCLILVLAMAGLGLSYYHERRTNARLRRDSAALQSSQKALQGYALTQMLLGKSPRFEYLKDYYRIYDLDFPADSFMLLAAKLRQHPFGSSPEGQAAAYTAVQEELTGILSLSVQPYFAELDGLLVCFYCEPRVAISPPSGNQRSLRELLNQQCAACAASLLEQHQIDVLFALGRYDVGGFGLHTNFISTKALLEQAMCSRWPGNVISDAGELTQKTDIELSGTLRQFYNCFICFKFEAAAEHLFHMVELRISNYYDSYQEAREVVADQLRFCVNMLELPLNVQLTLPEGGTIGIRDLMASPDAQSLQENLSRYFRALELYVTGNRTQAAPTTKRVYSYIETHYADPTISVSSISEQFHLNVSYLSRQFKQEYGCGVLESIHKRRIAQAKDLMSTGLSAGEVYPQVGYTSRRAFDSAFSRYEGITPKAYQDRLTGNPA